MTKSSSTIWRSSSTQQFTEVLSAISNPKMMQNFLRDVMTEKEIAEMSARLEAAKMLKAGNTYASIVAATKLSSRTVARISSWLQNGAGGYNAALDIVTTHHDHIPPARAE